MVLSSYKNPRKYSNDAKEDSLTYIGHPRYSMLLSETILAETQNMFFRYYAAAIKDKFKLRLVNIFLENKTDSEPLRICEKIGWQHYDDVHALFPNAVFIRTIRDPRDAMISRHNKFRLNKKDGVLNLAGVDPVVSFPEVVHDEFLKTTTDNIFRYEEFVSSPRKAITNLYGMSGLSTENGEVDNALDYLQKQGKNVFKSHGTSLTVKSTVNKWKTELSEEDKKIIKPLIKDWLIRNGYEKDDEW